MNSWVPTRDEAWRRLKGFLPRSADYNRERNFDRGPRNRGNTSLLSPYLRHRLISEKEVCQTVLDGHSLTSVEKFIQEVIWRTYWKGWLQMRPVVWDNWIIQRDRDKVALSEESQELLKKATSGTTEIECFDEWSKELVDNNYLHNHARMWFASIWIFTLRLPWTLGADFFLQHLADGDPASNTLGWRWVAGLQTPGKHYVARAENIKKYTAGRFDPGNSLEKDPQPLNGEPNPQPAEIHFPDPIISDPPIRGDGLWITSDDLSLETLFPENHRFKSVVGSRPETTEKRIQEAAAVHEFRKSALEDSINRFADSADCTPHIIAEHTPEAILSWAQSEGIQRVWLALPPVGPSAGPTRETIHFLENNGLIVRLFSREWDRSLWPYARSGFFQFRKKSSRTLSSLITTDLS